MKKFIFIAIAVPFFFVGISLAGQPSYGPPPCQECPPGPPGPPGPQGPPGLPGNDGSNGNDGLNGNDGIDGTNGRDGINGSNGLNGSDGTNGNNGRNGSNGLDGESGSTTTTVYVESCPGCLDDRINAGDAVIAALQSPYIPQHRRVAFSLGLGGMENMVGIGAGLGVRITDAIYVNGSVGTNLNEVCDPDEGCVQHYDRYEMLGWKAHINFEFGGPDRSSTENPGGGS